MRSKTQTRRGLPALGAVTFLLVGIVGVGVAGPSANGKPSLAADELAVKVQAAGPDIQQLKLRLEENVPIAARGAKVAVFSVYADRDIHSPTYGTELCVLQIPSAATSIKVVDTRRQATPTSLHSSLASKNSVIGSLNGSYFGSTGNKPGPLGLVRIESKTTHKLHPWKTGGVLAVTGSVVRIVPIREFVDRPVATFALQSNVLLVENGRNGIRDRVGSRGDRSAVAVTDDGYVVMAVLHQPGGLPATLFEFAALLTSLSSPEGGKLMWAINMDGGPGAHLQLAQPSRHCGSNSPNYIPNVIVAFR
jgi:uncharacterized protein YigE (DUF2233 family)